jgi:tetratricopeptide (TPR) repeat protein
MRSWVALAAVLAIFIPSMVAHAQDTVILAPAAAKGVSARAKKQAAKSIAASASELDAVSVSKNSVTAQCAVDPACVAKAAADLGATRVVSVLIASARGGYQLTVVLVDIASGNELRRASHTIAHKKLASSAGATVTGIADPEQDKVALAKALFATANEHYNLGDYEKALAAYEEAYRTKPLPAFTFNIAQCLRKLGKYQQAINMYQSFLTQSPETSKRELVESLITEAKGKIAESQQQTAEQRRAEKERLEIERKRAEAEAAAERTRRQAAADEARRQAELDKSYDQHPVRVWAYVGAGVGLLAAGAGATFALTSQAAQGDFDDAGCGDPTVLLGAAALDQCVSDKDKTELHSTLSRVFIGAGAVVIVSALTVYLLDPGNVERPNESRGASLDVGPGSIMATFRW